MAYNYFDYWNKRWTELNISQRSQGLAIDSQEIKSIQCGAMVQVAQELVSQGHKDVGLLYKPSGNNYKLPDGTLIATDILAIKENESSFMVVDCIISGMSPNAKPGWQQQGLSSSMQNWIAPPATTPEPEPEPIPPAEDNVIRLLTEIRDGIQTMINQNEIIIARLGT